MEIWNELEEKLAISYKIEGNTNENDEKRYKIKVLGWEMILWRLEKMKKENSKNKKHNSENLKQ